MTMLGTVKLVLLLLMTGAASSFDCERGRIGKDCSCDFGHKVLSVSYITANLYCFCPCFMFT